MRLTLNLAATADRRQTIGRVRVVKQVFLFATVVVGLALQLLAASLDGANAELAPVPPRGLPTIGRQQATTEEAPAALRQKAERGDAAAQARLGLAYYSGLGVSQDYAEAYQWFGRSAEQGHLGAMYYLSWMSERAEGVAQDYSEAYKWLAVISEIGQTDKPWTGTISKLMTPDQISEAQGRARGWVEAFQQRLGVQTVSLRPGSNSKIDIRAPAKIKDVKPAYPKRAQSKHVTGEVVVQAVIGPDGKVRDAKVLRSIPLLDDPALKAVRQWTFTPTLVNDLPVPVELTTTVNFTLQ